MNEPNSPGFAPERFDPNPQLTRDVATAIEREHDNRDRELNDKVAAVRRRAVDKDVNQGTRHMYDIAYNELLRLAQSRADGTGRAVIIPVRDIPAAFPPELRAWADAVVAVLAKHKITAPPLPQSVTTVTIEPRTGREKYRESLGMGASGKGGPLPNFSGGDNSAWLNVQGGAK